MIDQTKTFVNLATGETGMVKKVWTAHFHFVAWDCLSLGFHVCFGMPNVEIHVPFGFFRIGREERFIPTSPTGEEAATKVAEEEKK